MSERVRRAALVIAAAAAGWLVGGCSEQEGTPAAGASSAVVTDAATGLTWLRCALGQQWQEGRCTGEPLALSQSDAHARVEALNAERYQGIDRWRLPGIVELAALRRCDHGLVADTFTLEFMAEQAPVEIQRWCDKETTVPTIDAARFPDTPPMKFWSSSGSERHQVAYAVDFANAWIGINEDSASLYAVRPVADPAPRR